MNIRASTLPENWPRQVYVSEQSLEDELCQRVLSRLGGRSYEVVTDNMDPFSEYGRSCGISTDNYSTSGHSTSRSHSIERFDNGKNSLLLCRNEGSWLRACPGTSRHVCCNLWTIDTGEGCPFNCSYCYLQSYLSRNPTVKIYTNSKDLYSSIESRLRQEPSRLFRITTGEVLDSLALDPLTSQSCDLIGLFSRFDNAVLELKTKSDHIENVLTMRSEHKGRTVISWSVNARSICNREERYTASLESRILAAEKVVEAGYRVGFHFDPLVYFEGWEEEYAETISRIFANIRPEDVAWISVASLRYSPRMQDIMRRRFPSSILPYGEQFLAKDNKLRYIQPVRFKITRFIWARLKEVSSAMPVYMCMESSAAWRNIAGGPPVAGAEVAEVFTRFADWGSIRVSRKLAIKQNHSDLSGEVVSD